MNNNVLNCPGVKLHFDSMKYILFDKYNLSNIMKYSI